jgi:hypothetical protein
MAEEMMAEEVTRLCGRLLAAGCGIRSAHSHGGRPVIVAEGRPPLKDLAPCCLRADGSGADYHASVDGVLVAWHEAPRARWAGRTV